MTGCLVIVKMRDEDGLFVHLRTTDVQSTHALLAAFVYLIEKESGGGVKVQFTHPEAGQMPDLFMGKERGHA